MCEIATGRQKLDSLLTKFIETNGFQRNIILHADKIVTEFGYYKFHGWRNVVITRSDHIR